jgi:hypothetical protein
VSCHTILEPSMSYCIYLNVLYLLMWTLTWLLNSIKWTQKLITYSFICVLSKWSFYYERSCGCCKRSIGTIVCNNSYCWKSHWVNLCCYLHLHVCISIKNKLCETRWYKQLVLPVSSFHKFKTVQFHTSFDGVYAV